MKRVWTPGAAEDVLAADCKACATQHYCEQQEWLKRIQICNSQQQTNSTEHSMSVLLKSPGIVQVGLRPRVLRLFTSAWLCMGRLQYPDLSAVKQVMANLRDALNMAREIPDIHRHICLKAMPALDDVEESMMMTGDDFSQLMELIVFIRSGVGNKHGTRTPQPLRGAL